MKQAVVDEGEGWKAEAQDWDIGLQISTVQRILHKVRSGTKAKQYPLQIFYFVVFN